MKLTKDDIEIVNIDRPDHGIRYLYFHTQDGFSKEKCEQLKQQILDDYEKAKKWDEVIEDLGYTEFTKMNIEKDIQNQKLRELIEKRIEEENETAEHFLVCDHHCCSKYHEMPFKIILQKLLEESKNG